MKAFFTGLTIPQEYVCLGETLTDPLRVFLSGGADTRQVDVTETHLMLGYKPLLMGFTSVAGDDNAEILRRNDVISLSFYDSVSPNNRHAGRKHNTKAVAQLTLERVDEVALKGVVVFLYKGVHGRHRFINGFHQVAARLRQRFRHHDAGNVGLPGNLYDQVRIAYAVPRSIQLITVSEGTNMNMFPTDLHGPVGLQHYAGSLRIGGRATAQVQRCGRVVISVVPATSFHACYQMGKNHMQDLGDEAGFNLDSQRSATFGFPLPAGTIRYRELVHKRFVDMGIHRLHFYDIVHVADLGEAQTPLCHIHQFYGQWRVDRGRQTAMLIRH